MFVPGFVLTLCVALASAEFAQSDHRSPEENSNHQRTEPHTFSDYDFLGPLRRPQKIKSTTLEQYGKPLRSENTKPELSEKQEGFAGNFHDTEKQESNSKFHKSAKGLVNGFEVSETGPSKLGQRTTVDNGLFNAWSPNQVEYIYKNVKSFPILPFKMIKKVTPPMHHTSSYGSIEPSLSALPQQHNVARFSKRILQPFQSDISRPEFMANLEIYPKNLIPKVHSIDFYQTPRELLNPVKVHQKDIVRLPIPIETTAQYKASLAENLMEYLGEIINEIPAKLHYELKEFIREINQTFGKGIKQLLKDGHSNDLEKRMETKLAKAAKILRSMETYFNDKKKIYALLRKLQSTFNALKAMQIKNRESEANIKLKEGYCYDRKPNLNIFQFQTAPDNGEYVYTSPFLQTEQSVPLIPQENSHNAFDQSLFRPVDVHSIPVNYNYFDSWPLNQTVQRYPLTQIEQNNNPFPDLTIMEYIPNGKNPIKYNIPVSFQPQTIEPLTMGFRQWQQLYTPALPSSRAKIDGVYQPITTFSENFEHMTNGKDGIIQGNFVPGYKRQSFSNGLLASENDKTKESILRLLSLKNSPGFYRNSHESQPNYIQSSPVDYLHSPDILYNTMELRMHHAKNNNDFHDELEQDAHLRLLTGLNMRSSNPVAITNEEENTEPETKSTVNPNRALCPPGYIEYSNEGSDSCLAAGVPYAQEPPDKFWQDLHNVIF